MKQNGVRLVQRKFAQGVPIPASSVSVAPTPPERKPDPPYPPKNVYHNNMSARSLLDIVSMQNIHKHKQEPLVVLERLREDEIPSPPVPAVPSGRRARPRMRVPLRRRKHKGNKGNMCLRSGKRKSTEATKGPIKKRKKLSSESTDDIPLVYYFNRPTKHASQLRQKEIADKKEKVSLRERRASTATPRRNSTRERSDTPVEKPTLRADSIASDDRNFTFKAPPSPARLSYRLHSKKLAPAAARPLKKGLAKDARWSSLRSARAPSETRSIVRRLRNKVLIGKKPPKPAVRKAGPKTNKDDAPLSPPGPSGFRVPRPPPSESSESSKAGPSGFKTPTPPRTEGNGPSKAGPSGLKAPRPPSSEFSEYISVAERPDSRRASLESIARFLATKDDSNGSRPSDLVEADPPYIFIPSPIPSVASGVEDWCIPKAPEPVKAESVDFSTDIIQIGDPPDLAHIPALLNIEEHLDKTIMEQKVDKELQEIRDKISEELNSDKETGVDVPTKNNQKVKLDKDSDGLPGLNSDQIETVLLKDQKDEKDIETVIENDQKEVKKMEESEKIKDKQENKTKRVKGKGIGKKTVLKEGRKPKTTPVKERKTMPKRAAKAAPAQEEPNTRLLRNSREPPATDVYEFDEHEGTRPPSGLRRRTPARAPTPDPAHSPGGSEYMDVDPNSSRLVKINTTKEDPVQLTARLVDKEEIYKKQKNLIDNLTNSPALLHKFFTCLPTELQDELGNLAGSDREETYLDEKTGNVLEAPTYYPTAEEFEDPIKYYDKIAPEASKYGLCKIVPPDGFKPTCTMSDTIRFAVIYQYISKMYSRWGPVSRELAAIKAHLRTQSVVFARSPLLDGSEVNLPKLYHAVERNGGLSNVIQRKRWGRVADEMKLTKLQHPERKLDPIYMRYLLPYATLSDQERQSIMAEVEKCWTTKYQKMLERARNPFQRQNRMLGTECESESDDESEDGNTAGALHEAEDCIVQGRTMNLATFKKIATSLMDAHFDPAKQPPSALDVEKAYWRAVLLGTEHIVANTASIDTGEEGYGFPKDPQAEYGEHPWNLKVLARNSNNVLRYLGPVLGVTVPTLHLGMLFSTSCWHRDPHGLPWTEYMHSGAEKIWYGIPRDESANFRRAVETLCPAYCQNKSIWLASEITMVPPNILSEHGVKLSRLLQRPGEYVMVFPEAHSCSITTGFGISESVYFASNSWLTNVYKLFQELRNSCEPTMFSLEQLLLNGSNDPAAPVEVCSVLATLLSAELEHRRALEQKGLKVQERPLSSAPLNTSYFRAWNTRDQDECEYCRSTLFLSKVTGLTGRKSAVCPEHALRLLETKKHRNVDLHTLELLSSFTTHTLEEMLERLDSRPGPQQ